MELLLVKRESEKEEDWSIIQSDVKPMELCWQSALYQVRLDTSEVPDRVYSVNHVLTYYDVKTHSLMISPVFLAIFDHDQETKPMDPDVETNWVDAYHAEKYLPIVSQREMVVTLYNEFFAKEPAESLKVYPTRF